MSEPRDNLGRDDFDRAIREMYGAERLPPERMGALIAKIAAHERPMRLMRWRWLGAVAAVLVLCASLAVWMHGRQLTSRDVAEDVQRHHVKPFVADVTAEDFPALAGKMTSLDFAPILPARLKDEAVTVVGARYCNVGHTRGAQLRLRDQAGQFRTLCEFRAGDVNAIDDGQFRIEGLDVTIWHENGLVVAMTTPGS